MSTGEYVYIPPEFLAEATAYTLRVTASDGISEIKRTYNFMTRRAPRGTVTVSPSSGSPITTQFTLTAVSWTADVGSGITYQYGYYSRRGDATKTAPYFGFPIMQNTAASANVNSVPFTLPNP